MLELAVMLEGQNGLNWSNFQRLALAVEDLGFVGLYRSDHYTNSFPPDRDSLELWVSLTWLASHTRRIEFGSLVSPASFRHPTMTARMAAAVDDLSGGRLTLGLGAGWQMREHTNYGWDLLAPRQRFKRFEEALRIIQHLLTSPDPLDFDGHYFTLREAVLLPRPSRPGGPPILIGGNGEQRTLGLAARFAQEWNAVMLSPANFSHLNHLLDERLAHFGRPPQAVRRSMMCGTLFGKDQATLDARIAARTSKGASLELMRQRGYLIGTPAELVDRLAALESAGVQRLMLQWLDLDDLDGLEAIATQVLPQLS